MGQKSSTLNISKLENVGEGRMEINGEIIVIARKKEIKPKLTKIYKIGCLDVQTPSSVNVKTVLVSLHPFKFHEP